MPESSRDAGRLTRLQFSSSIGASDLSLSQLYLITRDPIAIAIHLLLLRTEKIFFIIVIVIMKNEEYE